MNITLEEIKEALLERIGNSKLSFWWYFNVKNHRSKKELRKYEEEAFDKVWLMRTAYDENFPAVKRILDTYDDIPKDGYDDWECGYWNGVLGTLRWVLGDDEKDNLDT